MNVPSMVAIQRRLIKNGHLKDTCQVERLGGVVSVVAGISTKSAPTNVEYESSTDIPCLVDDSRALLKDKNKYQAVVVDNYQIEFPYDFEPDETDIIIWQSKRFRILKVTLAGVMDVTTVAVIVHVGANE